MDLSRVWDVHFSEDPERAKRKEEEKVGRGRRAERKQRERERERERQGWEGMEENRKVGGGERRKGKPLADTGHNLIFHGRDSCIV